MSSSTLRRSGALLVSSLLALGAVPMLATSAAAAITSVTPSSGVNTGPVRIVVQGDGTPPFDPLADKVRLKNATYNESIRCGDPEFVSAPPTPSPPTPPPTPPPPTSDNDTLVVTCDIAAATPAAYDVVVDRPPLDPEPNPTSPDPRVPSPPPDDVRPKAFTVVGATPSPAAFSPSSRGQDTTTTGATITGAKLARNMTYEFLVGDTVDPGVTFTPTAVTSSQVTGTLTVASTALTGPHSLRVTTTDNAQGTLANALTVTSKPTVTDVEPNDNIKPGVGQGAVNKTVTITGTGFQPGVTVTEQADNPGISFGPVTYVSDTQITVPATVTATAALGSVNVVVRNPDQGSAVFALAINAAPIITTATPASRGQGVGSQEVVLTGTTFWNLPGKTTVFTIDPESGVTITSQRVDNEPAGCTTNCTRAVLTVDVPVDAATGARSIRATNPDGGTSTKTGALVINAKPTITSVTPSSEARGFTGNVDVNGTGFSTAEGGPTVSFGEGITVNGTPTVVSANKITVNITIAPDAAQGPRTVTVTNKDGGTASCTECFRVDALDVSGSTPSMATNDAPRTLTISGSGFSEAEGQPTVKLDYDGAASQADIVATNVDVTSPSSLVATFDFTAAAPGKYTIVVTNATGEAGACAGCFTVLAAASTGPVVTGVTPNKVPQGTENKTLTIAGQNFSNGSVVTFSKAGIVVESVRVVSRERIDVVVDIARNAATGPGDVTVTDAEGKSGKCTGCFEVTAAPVVSSVNPNEIAQGATRTVTIMGSGFANGAVVSFSTDKLTAASTVVNSASSITTTVTAAADAPTGPHSVTVTNPDGGTGTCAGCLTVNGRPTVTDVSPDLGGVGRTVDVTITGTGFASGTPTVTAGEGIVVSNVSRVSATSITARFSIAPTAATGPRDVTVTTPDGASATCAACFRVVSAPTVRSVSPSSRPQDSVTEVDITGTGFGPVGAAPKKVTISGDGVTAAGGTIASPTSITGVTVTVAPNAALGARDVTVENPDGGSGTCAGCFTVTSSSPMTVRLFDTKGTSDKSDDTETTAPVSGTTYRVTVTARQSAASDAPADTSYTGTPTLTTQPNDSQDAYTCASAVAGVAECTANFGDLGARTLTASGTGGDSNRVGTLAIVTQPIRLELAFPRTTATTGETLTYTVRPVAKPNASIAGYTATRRLRVTGTGSTPANNTVLDCGPGSCAFNVTFTTEGTKTIRVTDNGTPPLSTQEVVLEVTALGRFLPLTPARLLDTRAGRAPADDGHSTKIPARSAIAVQATGRGGVPATGVSAVAVNITAVNASGASHFTLYPTGGAFPPTSSINFAKGETVANLAVVKVGSGGRISIHNAMNPADAVLDVVGYYTTASGAGGRLIAVTPRRVVAATTIGEKATRRFTVTGANGVPADDVSGVVLSVTGSAPTKPTYLTVWPDGVAKPTASSVNVSVGRTTANLVMVPVDAEGQIQIFNAAGSMKVTADVVGYYTKTSSGARGRIVALVPARIVDTRDGTGGVPARKLGAGQSLNPVMTDKPLAGLPASGVSAVIINVTVTGGTATSRLTVYPSGESRPATNSVTFVAKQVTANLAVAKLGIDEKIRIHNAAGEVHVVVDIVGYVTS